MSRKETVTLIYTFAKTYDCIAKPSRIKGNMSFMFGYMQKHNTLTLYRETE